MDAVLDEKELMELMQELQKVKEENLEIINNLVNNSSTQSSQQVNKNNQALINSNKVVEKDNLTLSNENETNNLGVLNKKPKIEEVERINTNFTNNENFNLNYNLEKKFVDLMNQLISLVNNEFLLLKKENEKNSKFQKVFAKTLTTLISQSMVNLNELKTIKRELELIKQEQSRKKEESVKEVLDLLLKELGGIKANLDNLNKILSRQDLDEKEIKEKIIDLLNINKKINENLAEKIIKLEKELLLLIEGIEEMKVYLKLSNKIENLNKS